MKKLFTLLAALLITGSMMAETSAVTFSEMDYSNAQEITQVDIDEVVSVIFNKGTNSNAPKYYTTGAAIRCYGSNTFTVSAEGAELHEIDLSFGQGDGTNAITTNVGSYSNGVWTGKASEVVFTIGGSTGHRRLAGISVIYFTEEPSVSAPVFDVVAGSYYDPQTIHLSSETEGAVFFYTTDGTEPTSASSLYMPQYGIVLGEGTTTTIKAIAYNNDSDNPEYSDVVEKTYTIAKVYDSFDALVTEAGDPAGQKVVVNFSNVVIDELYTTKSGNVNGVYLTAAERKIEIYCYDVPSEWEVGGTISGTVKGEWKEYNGTWEVCPSSWDGITYKAAAGTVTPPADAVIEKYNASSFVYLTYEDTEWDASVAIVGNKMYIKDVLPYFANSKWIEGTIDNGVVTFSAGQVIGDLDLSLIEPELTDCYADCKFYGIGNDFNKIDATFSWNAETKTLKLTNYEAGADVDGMNPKECLIATDGWSDPDCTLTLVGTGVTTAIKDIKVEAIKASKTIENGKVVILRNGKKYNVVGVEL